MATLRREPSKLEMLAQFPMPESARLKGLYEYLNQNQDYIVNYEERKGLGKTFTTQVTESHIESINVRHKRVERCNGVGRAHNVLQIRSEIISKTW